MDFYGTTTTWCSSLNPVVGRCGNLFWYHNAPLRHTRYHNNLQASTHRVVKTIFRYLGPLAWSMGVTDRQTDRRNSDRRAPKNKWHLLTTMALYCLIHHPRSQRRFLEDSVSLTYNRNSFSAWEYIFPTIIGPVTRTLNHVDLSNWPGRALQMSIQRFAPA